MFCLACGIVYQDDNAHIPAAVIASPKSRPSGSWQVPIAWLAAILPLSSHFNSLSRTRKCASSTARAPCVVATEAQSRFSIWTEIEPKSSTSPSTTLTEEAKLLASPRTFSPVLFSDEPFVIEVVSMAPLRFSALVPTSTCEPFMACIQTATVVVMTTMKQMAKALPGQVSVMRFTFRLNMSLILVY
ncbi:MAG: hypothetical protein RIQ75_2028 [Pseudomonadota bacterium]